MRYQIPDEYYDKLLGGIIVTGGGANMKNIERAITLSTRIEKVRVAKFVTTTINTSLEVLKARNGMYNTLLGLLAKGDINCAGGSIDQQGNLFGDDSRQDSAPVIPDRKPRQAYEKETGTLRTQQEEDQAAEEARRKKEEEEQRRKEEERQKRE